MPRRVTLSLLLIVACSLCLDCSSSGTKRRRPSKPAAGSVMTLTDANFDAVVLRSEVPVLVDFWATWCGPCKKQAPIIEQIATTYAARAVMGKLDTVRNHSTATKYGIEGLPTLLIFKDGKVAKRFVGLTSKKALAAALDAALK